MSRYQYHTHTCKECGQEFKSNRDDARTCSAACRKRRARRKEEVERVGATAMNAIHDLERIGKQWPDLERQCRTQLERIKFEAWDLVPYVVPKTVTDGQRTEKGEAAPESVTHRRGTEILPIKPDRVKVKGAFTHTQQSQSYLASLKIARALRDAGLWDGESELTIIGPLILEPTIFSEKGVGQLKPGIDYLIEDRKAVTEAGGTETTTDDPAAIMRAAGVPELWDLQPAR